MPRHQRSGRRGVNERALGKTVLACDHTPALLVRKIIERYVQECRNTVLERNTRIVTLADLKVGESAPWRWSVVRVHANIYLQTPDRRRGREVLGDADADWQPFHHNGEIWVRRVA